MKDRYDEITKVTYTSILLNIILTVIKILSGIVGKSSSMISDGLHSASDVISSVGVLIGARISSMPNDKEHPYGHDKAETLVSFLLSLLLMYVSLKIGFEGIVSLTDISSIGVPTLFPLVVSVISIIIKEYQYRITIKVAEKINSPSLKADAWHHRSDAFSSIAAFVGIGGSILGLKVLDPIASIIVASFVAKVGYDILIVSANELIDSSLDKEQIDKIKSIIHETEGIVGLGELKSRKHGAMGYLDITICVSKDLSVYDAHEIATKLENNIIQNMDCIKGVTVHIEPCINCLNGLCGVSE